MSPLALSYCSYHEFQVRLVRIRPHGFVGGLQALDGDAYYLAGLDDTQLVRGAALGVFGDPPGDLGGDHAAPALATPQQAARIDPPPSPLNRGSEVDQADVPV